MIGEQEAKNVLDKVLGYAKADQAEGLLLANDTNLTRFANSAIHQNVAESNATLHVRIVLGKRIGQASTNDLSDSSLKQVVSTARDIARVQAENPDFVSLPSPSPIIAVPAFIARTADCTPEERAAAAGIVCARARSAGLKAAGAYSTEASEMAVANSLGISVYQHQTVAELSTVIMSDDSSGYAHRVSLDAGDVDADGAASEAVDKALRGRQPAALPAGDYEVVLEPYAVQDILMFLSQVGLNALALKEQRSFIAGKFGKQLAAPIISMCDDGCDTSGLPLPFDFEGVPKQRVDFFDQGIAKGVVYDSYLAFQEGRLSTGHALPSPVLSGPLPLNMFMSGGNASEEELIKSVKRGLLVTRFWYTRPVEPMQVTVTGMTRDGTFLIENGEIAGPVRNLRFTQSYLEALNNVEAITHETRLMRDEGFTYRAPAIKLSRWNFVSATEY